MDRTDRLEIAATKLRDAIRDVLRSRPIDPDHQVWELCFDALDEMLPTEAEQEAERAAGRAEALGECRAAAMTWHEEAHSNDGRSIAAGIVATIEALKA